MISTRSKLRCDDQFLVWTRGGFEGGIYLPDRVRPVLKGLDVTQFLHVFFPSKMLIALNCSCSEDEKNHKGFYVFLLNL